jgi:hypothetical protein
LHKSARLAAALLLAALAGTAAAQQAPGRDRRSPDRFLTADPSLVVAAELAFARLAQDKGQWTAFAQTSTDQAVMFVPQPVLAHAWLKGRANPAVAVKWQPYQVWMSCDGSLAVTKGGWQRPNGVGYFTTVWQRQRNGAYKWVMDQGDDLAQPLAEPEMIGGKVAECQIRPRAFGRRGREPTAAMAAVTATACEGDRCRGGGTSADGTLEYSYTTGPAGREFTVRQRQDGAMQEVLRSQVSAQ